MADAGGVTPGSAPVAPLVVWRLLDGKPGHESQSLGLVRALARLTEVSVHDLPARGISAGPLSWLFRRFPAGSDLPDPDFIIGAGHATHWPLLCARRARGGRAVVLMKPSLPLSWFDWVVAPEHDGVTPGERVLVTRGVLNAMRPGEKVPGSVLVMVGGESKHFAWDDEQILAQVETIIASSSDVRLTDSRRTPAVLRAEFVRRWPHVYQPWDTCPPGWLADALATAESAWVSEDSVSMIYEALSAGCAVGLLSLSAIGEGRLVNGLRVLEASGRVSRLRARPLGQALPRCELLAEADRVAALLLG